MGVQQFFKDWMLGLDLVTILKMCIHVSFIVFISYNWYHKIFNKSNFFIYRPYYHDSLKYKFAIGITFTISGILEESHGLEKESSLQKRVQKNEPVVKRQLLKCGMCREVFFSIHDISNHLKHRHIFIQVAWKALVW